MDVNKSKRCNQTVFEDWSDWTNKNIPGVSFAERHETLCQNWLDTKGKTPAEIFWDDIRGKTFLKQKVKEMMIEHLEEAQAGVK